MISGPPSDRVSIDQIRERLIERGYLSGPIERFVLRDLLKKNWPHVPGLLAALRAAAAGGPLLGALLALLVAATNRPRLGTLDTTLLWLYFTPIAACGLALIFGVVVAAGSAVSGRRRAESAHRVRAGLLVAIPLLGYVFSIWSIRSAGHSWVGDLLFVCGSAFTIAGLAWLAGLVSLASVIGATGVIPDRRRRSAWVWLSGGVVILLIGLGVRASFDRSQRDGAPANFDVPAAAARLLVVGVDGLDGDLFADLADRGVMPGMVSRLERAAVYPLIRPANREPAEVWTTLLTGTTATEHHVIAADSARLPGLSSALSAPPRGGFLAAAGALLPTRTLPTSGAVRSVRTAWEILGLRRSVLAVGWWASWPALPDPDAQGLTIVISDRVLPKLLAHVETDRDTWPASIFQRLATEFARDREGIDARIESASKALESNDHRRWLSESYLIDAWSVRVATRLWIQTPIDAAFVYLPGLDVLRNRLRKGEAAPRVREALLDTYGRLLDDLLAELMPTALVGGPDWILVADPGRVGGEEGFLAERGGQSRAACVGPRIDWLDVSPLVLERGGFPDPEDLGGEGPVDCSRDPTRPFGSVSTFGRRASGSGPATSAFDPELVERLRSLGYLD